MLAWKKRRRSTKGKATTDTASSASQLFTDEDTGECQAARKWKLKGLRSRSSRTPDLNLLISDSTAIVPVGLANSQVNQLVAEEELSKKQKVSGQDTQNARSAAAAGGSPRWAQ